MSNARFPRPGLTLAEVLVVLAILVALAGLVIPLLSDQAAGSPDAVTATNMTRLRDAVIRYRIDNPGQTPDLIHVGDLFTQKSGLPNWSPVIRTGWNGPYLHATGAMYSYTGVDGFDAVYGTGAAADACVMDAYYHADGRRRPIVLVSRLIGTQLYSWLQCAGPDGLLNVPVSLIGPPTPAASGTGSDFPTSAGIVRVDDMTLRVYP